MGEKKPISDKKKTFKLITSRSAKMLKAVLEAEGQLYQLERITYQMTEHWKYYISDKF